MVARGGWGPDETTCERKINWSREIFPKLANYTSTHKATSVGHDLITCYKNYLHSYERKYADVDCNMDESKTNELIKSIPMNTPRAGVTGTRSPGMTKRKPVGRPRASNLGSGGGGNAVAAATAPSAPSRGGNRGGARSKPKRTYPDGAKIKVFWPKENDWFFGTIVQQEYMPVDGQTYSKIEYEDGDEEVLNLANEKVKLIDEKSDDDDDDDDDGLVYVPRPTARRRGAADPSRAPFAADTAALINAATGAFGDESDKEEENKDEGRRRTRLNGADPNAPEPPPPKDRVEIVEEMMEHHNAARVLAELPNEFCTEDETYRLGYRMGLRRMAKVSTAMLIEKMQKMLLATSTTGGGGEDETSKAASGSVLDELFDDGKAVVSKEKAQALFNALIDAAYTPDKDAATYDAKGEPTMPKRAPEPEDPKDMPGMVKEEEENAEEKVEEKKTEDKDGSGGGGSSGNGGDDNDNNKGPGPSSGGGSAGGANGDQKPDDTNKDNEHNGGNNGDNEDDGAGATGFHASMLADKMDIDIPSPTKEKKEELKPAVAPTRNSGRQRTLSKKVLEAVETGLMKSPVKLPKVAEEPAAKRAKTENTAAMRTMQTSVAHGGVEKRNPNKNETSTASPSRPIKANEAQATTTNMNDKEEENAKKKPAPAATKQEAPKPAAITENGDEFVPLPPVPGPPEWVGPIPTVSNSDPEYLLHQLKVFIAKSGAVLDRAWRVTVAMRTQGASAGSYDATYWAPDNKRYRSRLEVARAVGVAPYVAPKKPKGEPRKPRDPNAPKRSSGGSGRSRVGTNFRRPLDSYPVVELEAPPPPPTQRVLCELLGDGTAVRWLEKHGLGEHAAAFVMHGILRKNQLFAPLMMQDMENFGLDLETGARVLKFIEETRENISSAGHLTVEQLTPVPVGRRVTSEVFCDDRAEKEIYYDPGTFLFDESELAGRQSVSRANPLFGLVQAF